jgi:UDPglucose 6-dehydrogenase
MKLAVVGTGYVGLVVGACFAENGNDVVCVDSDAAKVESLKQGRLPIYEPGLGELVARNDAENRLRFSTELAPSVARAQVVFIAVGTPPGEDGSADLTHVLAVARDLAHAMTDYTVVVTKSTVPVGTAARLREVMGRETSQPFSVVSNPEFLKQGAAIDDFMRPDRVVIGVEDQRAAELMRTLYAPFTRTGAPIQLMDCVSAELCKYASNAMLATRVSFMNEIAAVCELFDADVDNVRRAMAADRRIGPSFLFPGIGYGGSCFPKDIKALVSASRAEGYHCRILEAVEAVNATQKVRLVEKMGTHFDSLDGRTIGVWGLSFKPRTDDMREAPSVPIIESLLGAGAIVQAYDPEAEWAARAIFADRIMYAPRSYDALDGADALAIVTEWNEFREPDFARMRALMRAPVIFDGRNVFDVEQMRAEGFTYYSIGR